MILKCQTLNNLREFSEVLCVRDYKGFKSGVIYAQLGWNNGSQVVRISEEGDAVALLCVDSDDSISYFLTPLEEDDIIPYFRRIKTKKEDWQYHKSQHSRKEVQA